jgi:hypothetical protein
MLRKAGKEDEPREARIELFPKLPKREWDKRPQSSSKSGKTLTQEVALHPYLLRISAHKLIGRRTSYHTRDGVSRLKTKDLKEAIGAVKKTSAWIKMIHADMEEAGFELVSHPAGGWFISTLKPELRFKLLPLKEGVRICVHDSKERYITDWMAWCNPGENLRLQRVWNHLSSSCVNTACPELLILKTKDIEYEIPYRSTT